MARPTFDRKVDRSQPPGDRVNQVVADDINQLLDAVNDLYDKFDTVKTPDVTTLTQASFSGNTFQSAKLVGLTAQQDFNLYTNTGSGVMLKAGDGYQFVSVTGTITAEPADYVLLIFKSV